MEGSEKGNDLGKESSLNKSSPSASPSPKTENQGIVSNLLGQEVQKSRPDQWGLLTAISEKARKRTQGTSIILHSVEHVLGRVVADVNCMFDSPAVSGRHCTITRKYVTFDGRTNSAGSEIAAGDVLSAFVKDSSSNGTFINKEKLKKNGPEVRLRHGDVLSLVALPEQENAFSYLFREVALDSMTYKRKGSSSEFEADESPGGCGKRLRMGRSGKGMANAVEGPVSLDDVRRLQKSNEELRQQLEDSVLEMEKMRGEFRAAEALRLVEVKDVRTSVTELHVKQIEEIRVELESKTKELEESAAICVQQKASIEDFNHRLASAAQSRLDAEDTIRSLNTSVGELKKRLEDEFSERQKERGEWKANLELAVERTRVEAAEELKRHTESSARLQKQQQDIITGLQEGDKENRRLADSMRTKLEVERQAVIEAEEKGRRLGVQLQEERASAENACKRITELEAELQQAYEALQTEKEASRSAGAKVASLESAMETAITDLTLEKQRLQGARERIVLRETQLRAFYSTAAQVEALQQKQQDQLKVMLRALEDSDGQGEYSQSKRQAKSLLQTDLGNEARILVSLSCKQTPTPNGKKRSRDKDTYGERKDLRCGASEGKEKKTPSPEAERPPVNGTDWVDGDTQQEDEEPLIMPKSLLRSGSSTGVIECRPGAHEAAVLDCERKVASPGADQEDTQMLHDHPEPGATLLVADTIQVVGSSGAETPVGTRVSLNSRLSEENRKSGAGMDVDDAPTRFLLREDDHIPEREGAIGEQSTQLEVGLDVDDGDTMRINSEQRDAGETAGVDAGKSGIGVRLVEQTHLENGNNETRTICTDDLLTSEVAGSWALGTQASVHTGDDFGSHWNIGNRNSGAYRGASQQLERGNNEGTLCTEDLLASEVAGSWALGTPASVHADNESLSSDERNNPGSEEGGSQVATTSYAQRGRFRANLQNVLLEDMMQFADPVNSQNSLSPATTNLARNEGELVNETPGGAETRSGAVRGSSRVARQQSDDSASVGEDDEDEDDSTTDGGDDNDENGVVPVDGHLSGPLSHSPSMSSRKFLPLYRQSSEQSKRGPKRNDQTKTIIK